MPSPILLKRYLLALLAVLFVQAPMAHSASIGFQPDPVSADTGDSISLDLVISGLGHFASDSLSAFDISVGFDASVLSFTGYSLGDLLGDVGAAEAIDVSAGAAGGTVSVAEVSLFSALGLDALQPGEFAVATLNFDVINLAMGAVTELSVLTGAALADTSGYVIAVTGEESGLVKSSVPAPATGLLLLAALFGWLTLKRRQSV
ncbi:MAG: cohesin domain-containing protein [Halioglobus sp.]|nr:cohesin domain-containing protein [Halioglobus sp.]